MGWILGNRTDIYGPHMAMIFCSSNVVWLVGVTAQYINMMDILGILGIFLLFTEIHGFIHDGFSSQLCLISGYVCLFTILTKFASEIRNNHFWGSNWNGVWQCHVQEEACSIGFYFFLVIFRVCFSFQGSRLLSCHFFLKVWLFNILKTNDLRHEKHLSEQIHTKKMEQHHIFHLKQKKHRPR